MIGGVSFPILNSYASPTAITSTHADFPISNLLAMLRPNRPVVAAAAGAFSFSTAFDTPRQVDFLALVSVNVTGGQIRIRAWSGLDSSGAALYDSGTIQFWPAGSATLASYILTRPFKFPSVITAQTIRVDVTPDTSAPVRIGALCLGRWWEWPDIKVDEERGFDSRSIVNQLAGGVDVVTRQWSPRTQAGRRSALTSSVLETSGIDFQRNMGTAYPFVFVRDINDASRWPRETFLAKNAQLPAMAIDDTNVGDFPYSLVEHIA